MDSYGSHRICIYTAPRRSTAQIIESEGILRWAGLRCRLATSSRTVAEVSRRHVPGVESPTMRLVWKTGYTKGQIVAAPRAP